eukprot:1160961-Pelagomonas_calceolata.AAC.5
MATSTNVIATSPIFMAKPLSHLLCLLLYLSSSCYLTCGTAQRPAAHKTHTEHVTHTFASLARTAAGTAQRPAAHKTHTKHVTHTFASLARTAAGTVQRPAAHATRAEHVIHTRASSCTRCWRYSAEASSRRNSLVATLGTGATDL